MTLSYRYYVLHSRFISWITRNPRLEANSDTARKVLRQPDLDRNELAEYRQLWTQKYWRVAAVIILSILIGAKYLLILMLTFKSLDHSNSESNLKLLAPDEIDPKHGAKQFSFSCLRTNCTRPLGGINSQGLAHDLRKLPYLYLCHRTIASTGIYSLWDTLDIVAFIHQTVISIFILVLCLFYPILQLLVGNFNELYMFVVAPKATLNLVKDKMIAIYHEFSVSFLNYRMMSVAIRIVESRNSLEAGVMQIKSRKRKHELVTRGGGSSLKSSHLTSSSTEEFVIDCIPAVRTEWWRRLAPYLFTRCSIPISLFIILIEFCICLSAEYCVYVMALRKNYYKKEMDRQQCAIWLAQGSQSNVVEFVDVQDPILNLNPYILTEYATCFILTMLILGGIINTHYIMIAELNLWILELEFKLMLAIELVRLHNTQQPNSLDQTSPKTSKQSAKFCMAQVRDTLIASTRFNAFAVFRLSLDGFYRSLGAAKLTPDSKGNAKIAFQKYAIQLLEENEEGAHIECLEKVYLNFRLFVDLLSAHGRIVAPLVILSYTLIYFFAFVGVYYTRNIRDFTYEALLFIIFFMLLATIFNGFGAAFHPRAMRLIPLVWSLVAQITCTKDPKLEHVRLLWLKLEDVLDRDGGMYLKAVGVSFSYSSVMQLILGTSTVMLLALK